MPERKDPCDASPDQPLVLLPVRLETRFGGRRGATTLRVRIYPDEAHVDDLVRGLDEQEAAAGRAYWSAVWSEPPPEGAWEELVAAVGRERAEWVAHACTPSNLEQRGSAPAPSFPATAPPEPRRVVARALPDRFVVLATRDGRVVARQTGKPIPRDLTLTPIPLEGEQPERLAGALSVPDEASWTVDYDKAVDVGMAVTLKLGGAATEIDRVVAIGARPSLSPAAGADELEDLLVGHRFGAGLDLLAQGTPTNNADAARSPYRPRRDPEPPPLAPARASAGGDAAATAAALGVDPDLLAGLAGDGHGEQEAARLANTALWPPGWGEYLSRLDARGVPGLDDAERESARLLFRDHVRGRGPAAALRIGAQPYGVLPASDLASWKPQAGETTAGIVDVVRGLLGRWRAAAERNVPLIRSGDPDIDATTLEVLGSSPTMQGLRVRPVVSDEVADSVRAALGLDPREYEAERLATAAVFSGLLGVHASKAVLGSLHDETRPLPLPLASERDAEFVDALLGSPSRTLPVDSVLQALLALAWQSSDLSVAEVAPATVVPTLIAHAELSPALRARISALAGRADAAPAEELHGAVAGLQDAGVEVAGASKLLEFQPAPQVQTSLAEVALSAPPGKDSRMLAASALAGWLAASGRRSEVREAMRGLAGTGLAERGLAVAETLDCSSHRLDAWATGVFAERRARRLQRKGETGRGLTIGAYGVVEELRPASGGGRDGWIHAPSTGHAVAAGMLRGAQLGHLPEGGDGGPFAIDLSSGRMRAASHLIDGVRQGQQLGALLGYRIERGLAEAGLARLQLSLREVAPLAARRLSDAEGDEDQATREAVAATDVVDGVLLLKRRPPGDSKLRERLDREPENAYLEKGDWKPLTNPEWEAVTGVMRDAADALDAVADAMLGESVLQLAGGNPQRSAAALDAMSSGASPSAEIDVLEARDEGERLNHRVLAVVGATPPASGWDASRPRAVVEPRLEAWAAARLGDPAEIVVAEPEGGSRILLSQAGLAALDLVFAADAAQLERALRVAIPELGDAPLATGREAGWPEGLRGLGQALALAAGLRALIAGARPLLPDDLAGPGEAPARDLAGSLGELATRAAGLGGSLAAAVASLEAAVATIPEDGIVADQATADGLLEAAFALEPFAVPLEPFADRPLDLSWVRSAWQEAGARAEAAQARAQLAQERVAQLESDPPGTTAGLALDAVQEAVAAVFGDGFLVVPLLAPGAGPDRFVEAVGRPAFEPPAQSALRRFVRDVGTVRPQVTRFSETLLLGGALGRPVELTAVQLAAPGEDGEPAAGADRWAAGPLPPEGPWPDSPLAHVVLDRVGGVEPGASLAGLVLDAWVEDLPAQPGPKADPEDPRPERARTGLAIHSELATARAPQALLCAISPDGRRWTTESLLATVEGTLDLARARMATLERLGGEGLALPALYERSSSLQGKEEHLFFGKLAAAGVAEYQMPFVRETS